MKELKKFPALADSLQELADEYSIRVLIEAVLELAKELEQTHITDEIKRRLGSWANR